MRKLPPLPSISEILKLYGLRAVKDLSQNFLLDLNVTDKIVSRGCAPLSTLPNKTVLEVGPGVGPLTRSILSAGAGHVVVVEKDERFIAPLHMLREASGNRLTIVQGDILEVNEQELAEEASRAAGIDLKPAAWEDEAPLMMIGNLPFGISSPLIIKWIRAAAKKEGAFSYGRVPMILMFQKEVAVRMAAPSNTTDFGRLSVLVQNYCDTKLLFDVGSQCFVPPPKVDASVIQMVPRVKPLVDVNVDALEMTCTGLFVRRRKALRQTLKSSFSLASDDVERALDLSQLNGDLRPQQLKVKDFGRLALALSTPPLSERIKPTFQLSSNSSLSAQHSKSKSERRPWQEEEKENDEDNDEEGEEIVEEIDSEKNKKKKVIRLKDVNAFARHMTSSPSFTSFDDLSKELDKMPVKPAKAKQPQQPTHTSSSSPRQ